MDRGWRRSGELLYLPDASRSCCPHYTIRLPASGLKTTRDQRQALNRWNRYVLGEKYLKEVSLKYPKTKEEKKQSKTTFDLLSSVHESDSSNLKPDITADHTFSVTLESDAFTEEKFALFSNYQSHVHHETDAEISRSGFRRFLCDSPLHRHESTSSTDVPSKRLGSYHHMYRLDGRLIAMSVLDLLPHAVSGVYFIYHSDFEKWSLGKLSALREAALAIEGGYEFLYMGYYIHSCAKMRYKADYRTQMVLDYDTGLWDPLDDNMKALMSRRKWVSMGRERKITAALAESNMDIDHESSTTQEPSPEEQRLVSTFYAVDHPTPLEAMDSSLSILELSVPGTMSLAEMQTSTSPNEMQTVIRGFDGLLQMQDLVPFANGSDDDLLDSATLKGVVAELAAAIGPEVARDIAIDWRY